MVPLYRRKYLSPSRMETPYGESRYDCGCVEGRGLSLRRAGPLMVS